MLVENDKLGINAHLNLSGTDSAITLNSDKFYRFEGDEFGWFDIDFRDMQGNKIWVHNAINNGMRMPAIKRKKSGKGYESNGKYTSNIYPNYTIVDSQNLGPTKKIKKISFELLGLEDFFINNIIEWQIVHKLSEQQKKIIKSLRYTEAGFDYDFFDPSSFVIIHKSKKLIQFNVDGNEYAIEVYGSNKLKASYIASIKFLEATQLDYALEKIWNWRFFFNQLSLNEVPMTSIYLSGPRSGNKYASLYISNWGVEVNKQNSHQKFHPIYNPYSKWSDRKKLTKVMQKWLSLSDERMLYRRSINEAIKAIYGGLSYSWIISLCAAIESLRDFTYEKSYTKNDLKSMANAAKSAIDEGKVVKAVSFDRLRGLLGQLNSPSLKDRLRWLCQQNYPVLEFDDIDDFVDIVSKLRNTISHGEIPKYNSGELSSIVELLLNLCILYDQLSCGMVSNKGTEKYLLAKRNVELSWMRFNHYGSKKL